MIIDSNMHWLPENLFDDEALLASFLNVVPKQYGVHARLVPIPGKNLRQIEIEQPKGYPVQTLPKTSTILSYKSRI